MRGKRRNGNEKSKNRMSGARSLNSNSGVILNGGWRSEGSIFLKNENIRSHRFAIHEQLLLVRELIA